MAGALMGQFIIKASRYEELYLIWSTIVDAPVMVFGSREELRKHLWHESFSCAPPAEEVANGGPFEARDPDSRIARADTNGTSLIDDSFGGWDEPGMWIGEGAPNDGWRYQLPRDQVGSYIRACLEKDWEGANKFLRRTERIED